MAKNKFHISNGEPKPCNADKKPCPIGGEHFDNAKQAKQHIEAENAKKAGGAFGGATLSKGRANNAAGNADAERRAKELFEYAKESALANVREDLPGLFVIKYHRKVFYNSLWNKQLEDCRGIVFDKDGKIVALPFTKIYNDRIEKNSPVIDDAEPVKYARKVNGFMGALSFHNGEPVYSTTGSLTSDYVQMFKGMMSPEAEAKLKEMDDGHTYLFEVVHPDDPHIIPEDAGLYLLGSREKHLDSPVKLYSEDEVPEGLNSIPTEEATMGDVRAMSKKVKHEGFVVYTEDGRSTKIKSPLYLTTKFVARAKGVRLTATNAKERVEEEYYPLIDAIQADSEAYTAMNEQERLEWVRDFLSKQ